MISDSTYKQFANFYASLSTESINDLKQIYSPHIIFEDPVMRIEGLDALERHYRNLLMNVGECRFEIYYKGTAPLHSYVHWQMSYRHPRLNCGKTIEVAGISVLQGHDKIEYQRDFYDMGALLYEQLPIVGNVIRGLRRRLAK